jgi:copper(I)-binding protein
VRRAGPGAATVAATLGLGLACLAGCGSGHPSPASAAASSTAVSSPAKISVSGAYIPLPASPGMAVAYFDLSNTGGSADQLIGVSSPAVGSAALEQSTATSMSSVDGVDVPAHGEAHLARGGTHVMLMGLEPAPAIGQTVELDLTFQHSGTVVVRATVRPLTYQPPK